MTIKISNKGWVVIPADLRKKYDLKPGTQVHIVDYGGVLALLPALQDPLEQAAGMLTSEPSLAQALLAERALERQRGR